MADTRTSFTAGARSAVPILAGTVPFALIVGTVTASAGVDSLRTVIMSILLTAGAAQLAAAELLAQQAPALVIVLTGLVINLRFIMYSASISPYLRSLTPLQKGICSFLLTDQAYALSIMEFTRTEQRYRPGSFYTGTALVLWITWVLGTSAGAVLGGAVPKGLCLDFAIPLTFAAILIPLLRNFPSLLAAAAGAGFACVFASLPYNLGLVIGASGGILCGYFAAKRGMGGDNGR